MYNSLKKYGLSDTKHEIKFHLDNCSPYRSTQKKIQPKEPSSNFVTVSNFTLDEEMAQKSQEKKLVLDYLLSLIERRER